MLVAGAVPPAPDARQGLDAKAGAVAPGGVDPRVHLLPNEIDEGIARRKLQALGLEIDTMTDAQQQFRRSWEAFA